MSLRRDVIWILRRFGVHPKKSRGQHFLVDEKVMEKILEALEPRKEDVVLEIGSGIGIMTNILGSKVKKVVGVEKDVRLAKIAEEMARDNVEILYGDFLDLEVPKEVNKVIGNIPYNISSKVLEKVLRSDIERAVLTFQWEFAERVLASPGNKKYGRITILAHYYSEVELVEKIPPKAFYPRPKVESAVLLFKRRKRPLVEVVDEGEFFEFVKELFSQRRKKIKTILRNFDHPLPRNLELILEKRPEELSVVDLGELFNEVKKAENRRSDR